MGKLVELQVVHLVVRPGDLLVGKLEALQVGKPAVLQVDTLQLLQSIILCPG